MDDKNKDTKVDDLWGDNQKSNNLIIPTEIDGKKIVDPFDRIAMAYYPDEKKKAEDLTKKMETKVEIKPEVKKKPNKKKGNKVNTKINPDKYDVEYDDTYDEYYD